LTRAFLRARGVPMCLKPVTVSPQTSLRRQPGPGADTAGRKRSARTSPSRPSSTRGAPPRPGRITQRERRGGGWSAGISPAFASWVLPPTQAWGHRHGPSHGCAIFIQHFDYLIPRWASFHARRVCIVYKAGVGERRWALNVACRHRFHSPGVGHNSDGGCWCPSPEYTQGFCDDRRRVAARRLQWEDMLEQQKARFARPGARPSARPSVRPFVRTAGGVMHLRRRPRHTTVCRPTALTTLLLFLAIRLFLS